MRYEYLYFCEDNNCASSFMADLAMGYYHKHSTMVGDQFVKVEFWIADPILYL